MDGFREGQKVWVEEPDGSLRPGVYVGDVETTTWFADRRLRTSRFLTRARANRWRCRGSRLATRSRPGSVRFTASAAASCDSI